MTYDQKKHIVGFSAVRCFLSVPGMVMTYIVDTKWGPVDDLEATFTLPDAKHGNHGAGILTYMTGPFLRSM